MSLLGKISSKLVPARWRPFYDFIRTDPSRKEPIPLHKKIAMWRRGFHANRWYYYNLDKNDRRLYVSDFYNLLTYPKNGRYTSLIDDKLYLPTYLHKFPQHLPQYYFLLLPGRALRLYGDRAVVAWDSAEFWNSFLGFVQRTGCVGKPTCQSCGEGVLIFQNREGILRANNKPYTQEELCSRLHLYPGYLISEYVQQHPYAVALNPTTTNTVRLLTCWDSATNKPFLARGFHRIGRPTMFGADNGALGGLITFLDVARGTLGPLAFIQKGRVEYRQEHPDSGVPVAGTPIPHFEAVAETVLRMCYELNYIPYIAWDIVITQDSFKVLELNSNTDMYGYQLFEPLLSDPRLLRFYQSFVTPRNRKYFMK